MNRRGFLRRVVTGAVGAAILSRLPVSIAEPIKRAAGLTFRGIPIVWDSDCRSSAVYFINKNAMWKSDGGEWKPLSEWKP
jgi:hypothetical protein